MGPYLSSIAPIIAVINGVIAVYASQFKPEHTRTKTILLISAIVLGIIAVGSTILSQTYNVSQQRAEKLEKEEIRIKLASYISSSTNVLNYIRDNNTSDADAEIEANRWYKDVQIYVADLGQDYLTRIQNTYGISPLVPNGVTSQSRSNLWTQIYMQSVRLNEFVSEFSK